MNDAACGSVGLDRRDILGKTVWETFPPAVGTNLEVQYRRAFEDRVTVEFENHYEPLGRWFANKVFPTPDGGIAVLTRDVTARKRDEETLRQQTALLWAISDTTADLIFAKDRDGRLTFANPATLAVLGLSERDALGKNEAERGGDPAQAERIMANDRRIMAAGQPEVVEEEFTGPLGTHVYMATKSPLRGPGGEVSGLVGISRDVTDRRRAEETLRYQADLIQSITDNATTAIFMMDARSRCTFMNPAAERMTGFAFKEVEGGVLHDFIHHHRPDGRPYPMPECPIDRALPEHGEVRDHEDLFFRKNGEPFPVLCNARVIYKQGVAVGTVIEVRDVTEQRRAADERLLIERRFRTLVEQVKDYAIFTTDLEGRATSWNEGVGRVLGYDEAEWVGHDTVPLIFTPEARREGVPQREMGEAAATGRAGNDRWMMKKGGVRFFANGTTTALRGDDGAVAGFIKVMRDMTEQNRLEEELREVAARLSEADRRKDEFLATLAHELRNPLAPIRNGLQIMKLVGGDAGAVEKSRSMMERQVSQMAHLIDDLMDLSRISRGKIALQKTRLRLAEPVGNAVDASRPLIEERGHDLAIDIPPDPVYVDGDLTRLSQVFGNLLNNAAKYTERGGRIRLGVRREGGDAVVAVEDNGVGIPAPMLPRVFDMFTQVDRSLEKSQGGLGIGLNIVRRLVEMHGGTIAAESGGHGEGSRFTVRLPVVQSGDAHPDHSSDPKATAACRRILVVDDNRDGADSLAEMLRIMGNDTQTAHDGLEAVAVAEAFRPDVILMDIGMPKLNGYEACRRIRAEPWGKGTVIVACTGWGQEEDRRQSQEAGFDSHMVKPVDPAALERMLAELTARTG